MISVSPNIQLNEDELQFRSLLSSGPGGQNVNKVASAIQLRFAVGRSTSLPDGVRNRLVKLAGNRMNRDGELVITARRHRTQERNREDAIDRLVSLIRKAAEKPKIRIKTKPSVASKRRRLESKRQRSDLKRERRPVKPPAE